MLLPPASRAECHFIDRPLLTYLRRAGSHSRLNFRFPANLARMRQLAALLGDLTDLSECDRERYHALARQEEKKAFAHIRGIKRRQAGADGCAALEKNIWM